MKILRNYILKELITPFLMSVSVLTFILIMGNLIKLADLVINKGMEIAYVGKLFLFMIPYLFTYTIPMAMLIATLLVFGRLSADNEITAMRGCGLSLWRITTPCIIVAFILSLASIPLNDKILPRSHFAFRKALREIGVRQPTSYIEAGRFIKSFPGYIIFVYEIHKNIMNNIRIYQPQENGPARTIVAERGRFIPYPERQLVKLILENGTSEEPNPTDPNTFYKINFRAYEITLDLEGLFSSGLEKKPKEMTMDELRQEIKTLEDKGVDTYPLYAEFHKKIAISFATLALVLVALPLGIKTKRHERSINFGISLAVLVAYWLLFVGGEAIAIRGILPAWFSMWTTNVLLMISGLIFLRKADRA